MKKSYQEFNYEKKISSSDDIMEVRDKFHHSVYFLGIEKPQLTVLTTAFSDINRLFLNKFVKVNTKICNIKERDTQNLYIRISGQLNYGPQGGKQSNPIEVKHELNRKLKRIEKIFSECVLSFEETGSVILTLKKTGPSLD